MKLNKIRRLPLLLFLVGGMACKTDSPMAEESPIRPDSTGPVTNPISDNSSNRLRVQVGSSTFQATLLSNPTVTAFKARLTLTVSMSELNGNEKLYDFPTSPNEGPLPTNSANPRTINTGDLMLYGSNTLVLFYKTFPTVYSYTKLGQIDNPAGLERALGSGSVTVTFELE
jgi:hypothetical protein